VVIDTAVIAVAGSGIRMKPYSESTPKELLDVGGKPILDYVVKEAIDSGVSNLVFITNEKKQAIDRYIESLDISNICIRSIRQKEDLPGFGGAVLSVKHEVNGPFMLLTGDSIFLSDKDTGLLKMSQDYERYEKSVVGLSVVSWTKAPLYGVVYGEQISSELMAVDKMIEKPKSLLEGNVLAMNGRYVLDKKFFDVAGIIPGVNNEIQITDVLKELELLGRIIEDKWLDTGTIEGWRNAQRMMAKFNDPIPKN